jgi:hypothetical protein
VELSARLFQFLLRSNTIEISPFKRHLFTAFQGASRIGLGALFGFVFVCCVKANILLGILSEKPSGLFAFSILAGFSETFVPELLKRMETEATKSSRQKLAGRTFLKPNRTKRGQDKIAERARGNGEEVT